MSLNSPQRRVFKNHCSDFVQYLDVPALHPSLIERGMLTNGQSQELSQSVPGNTNVRKVGLLLEWLPRSCGDFLEKLIESLEESGELRGHSELARTLREELDIEQWQELSPVGGRLEGVDSAELVISQVEEEDEGLYRCRVTDQEGSAISKPSRVLLGDDSECQFDGHLLSKVVVLLFTLGVHAQRGLQ